MTVELTNADAVVIVSIKDRVMAALAAQKAAIETVKAAQIAALKPGLSDDQADEADAALAVANRAKRAADRHLATVREDAENQGKGILEPAIKAVKDAKADRDEILGHLRDMTDRTKLTTHLGNMIIAAQVILLDAQDALTAIRKEVGVKPSAGSVGTGTKAAPGQLHGDADGNLRHWMSLDGFESLGAANWAGVTLKLQDNGVLKRRNLAITPEAAQWILDNLDDDLKADGGVKLNGQATILRDRCARFLQGEQTNLTGAAAKEVA